MIHKKWLRTHLVQSPSLLQLIFGVTLWKKYILSVSVYFWSSVILKRGCTFLFSYIRLLESRNLSCSLCITDIKFVIIAMRATEGKKSIFFRLSIHDTGIKLPCTVARWYYTQQSSIYTILCKKTRLVLLSKFFEHLSHWARQTLMSPPITGNISVFILIIFCQETAAKP